MDHAPPLPTVDASAVDLRTALGLAASEDDLVVADREAMLEGVAPLWPVAALALLLLPAALLGAALWGGQAVLAVAIGITGVLAAGFGATMWALVAMPASRRLAPHHRIGLAVASSGGIAIALTLLANDAARLAAPHHQLAGMVGAIGVIVVAVTALSPLRAATLAYAAGLVAATLATRGFTPASAAAVAIGALFAIGTLAVSRRRLDSLAERHGARTREQLARRLVNEYESHGPGWFWQTDSAGRLTYLSDKDCLILLS